MSTDVEPEHGVSSTDSRRSSHSTGSLDETMHRILSSYEGKSKEVLDSNELSAACKEFGISESSVKEIMEQFGVENEGDLKEKLAQSNMVKVEELKDRIDAELQGQNSTDKEEHSPRQNEKSGAKADSNWELDSGTHDLATDPLQQIMSVAANAASKGQSRSTNFLELANTLHLAALASLKSEIVDVTGKLQQVTEERNSLRDTLSHVDIGRKELVQEYEGRLSTQAQQNEEHITELQSVIAELNKKLSLQSANKIDEDEEEMEIESQTSEHGSQSESESLESTEGAQDGEEDEMSKVVGGLEYAIEREDIEEKTKDGKEKEKVSVKGNGTIINKQETGQEQATTTSTKDQPSEQDIEASALTNKCQELRDQCQELEKKKHILEKQLRQACIREYVSRKRSAGSADASDGQTIVIVNETADPREEDVEDLQVVTTERDALRAKLKKTDEDMEKVKRENTQFREERDRLRKRVFEMQDQVKALHHKSLAYENRQRAHSVNEFNQSNPSKSPRTPRADMVRSNTSPPGAAPWEHRRSKSGTFGNKGEVSSRENLVSPRISRRSSSENLSIPSPQLQRKGSQTSLVSTGRKSTRGCTGSGWPPDGAPPVRPHPGSAPGSVSGGSLGRRATSDLGSSTMGSQEITVAAMRMHEEATHERIFNGEKCIRVLSQLPEFSNGKMPSSFVQSVEGCRNIQEVFKALFSYCDEEAEKKLKEYELEIERLTSKLDHLQAQNNVVSLSLEESRSNAERMSMLVGKYESNNTALQLALNISDQVIEACEVLLHLSESEQSCLLANCRAAGVNTRVRSFFSSSAAVQNTYRLAYNDDGEDDSDHEDTRPDIQKCIETRRVAENDARNLLQKLDRNFDGQTCHGGGGQPWESVSSNSRTSSTGSSNDMEFTREEAARLKSHIQQLRSERSTVGLTVLELESLHEYPPEPSSSRDNMKLDASEAKLDLENAVLMQELMAFKEEKAELKAKNYLIEKEKKALELKINSRDAQEHAYIVHIEHLKAEVKEAIKKRKKLEKDVGQDGSLSGSGSNTPSITLAELKTSEEDVPPDLYEAARREKKLKARIQELVETLESMSKNNESRHTQTAEYISDLKRANGALVAAYEKAKKKHGARLRKLESQMMSLVERHDAQVGTLKERIVLLEEELKGTMARQNETAL